MPGSGEKEYHFNLLPVLVNLLLEKKIRSIYCWKKRYNQFIFGKKRYDQFIVGKKDTINLLLEKEDTPIGCCELFQGFSQGVKGPLDGLFLKIIGAIFWGNLRFSLGG